MNPFKTTLLLAKYKKNWEPIMMEKQKGNTKRLFNYNDPFLKKILYSNNMFYFEGSRIDKTYIIGDIDHIIQTERKKYEQISNSPDILIEEQVSNLNILNQEEKINSGSSVKTETDSENNTSNIFIKPEELEELKKLKKTKLIKMRLEELHKIVDKLKIIISIKNPTKSVIIEGILLKLSELNY
jgi:hypothetical protein